MLEALSLFVIVLFTAIVAHFLTIKLKQTKLLLAFSASFLLAICFFHLLPEVYQFGNYKLSGIFILSGFLTQIVLEFFSQGIEHGHQHVENKQVIPWGILISLNIHAFIEGLPLNEGVFFHTHSPDAQLIFPSLLVGIILHKIPITIALFSLLKGLHISKKILWINVLIFAAMAPLGVLLSTTISISSGYFYTVVLSLATGIFMHISTTILFEFSENHKFNILKFFIVVLGVAVAYLLY